MSTVETATPTSESSIAYTPGALLNVVGNSLQSPMLNKVFKTRGLYRPGKGVNYNGAYYDVLKTNSASLISRWALNRLVTY